MNQKIHYVYVTTNLVNGKQYIGDHTINKGKYYIGSGNIMELAIQKYGAENFFKEILEWFPTRKEAFIAQEKYINEFNTLSPNGYNISPTGGMNENGGLHSEESKEKNRQSHLGQIAWNKGIKLSEEHRKNMSISRCINKCALGENNGMYGIQHSQETKNKIRIANIGKKHSEETIQKQHIASSGNNNPMYGKSIYNVWLIKFGKEQADSLYNNWKYKQKETAFKKEIKICPYCGMTGKGAGIIRYHFNNCKLKKETV
jgi:group I intron endonuclease